MKFSNTTGGLTIFKNKLWGFYFSRAEQGQQSFRAAEHHANLLEIKKVQFCESCFRLVIFCALL
jgi:hypothetical protein